MGFRLKTFSSKLAKRWFRMLLVATLLPMSISGYIVYEAAVTRLESQALEQLRDNAKYFGRSALENLRRIERRLSTLDKASSGQVDFSDLAVKGAVFEWSSVQKNTFPAFVSTLVSDVAASREARLVVINGQQDNRVLLAVPVGAAARAAAIEVDMQKIVVEPILLPAGMRLCISQLGETLSCIVDPEVSAEFDASAAVSNSWELFLDSSYRSGIWRIEVSRSHSDTFAAVLGIKKTLIPGTLLVVILTLYAGLRMVRYTLGPIEKLASLSRRFEAGERQVQIDIQTGDELQALGGAFNSMTARIGEQFDLLEALGHMDKRLIEGANSTQVCELVLANLVLALPAAKHSLVIAASKNRSKTRWLHSDSCNQLIRQTLAQNIDDWFATLSSQSSRVLGDHPPLTAALGIDPTQSGLLTLLWEEEQLQAVVVSQAIDIDDLTASQMRSLGAICYRLNVALTTVENAKALFRNSHFDEISGLINRQTLVDRLTQAVLRAPSYKESACLLVINLDRFGRANELLGFGGGNVILRDTGQRLADIAGADASTARLGGSEFAILSESIASADEARQLGQKILAELIKPFDVGGETHVLSASIGITLFGSKHDDAESMLIHTNTAVRRAKLAGGNQLQFSDQAINREAIDSARIEQSLRQALRDNDGLTIHYQPKIDCQTQLVTGAEALLRWNHSDLGNVSPDRFIAAAENCGLIDDLGYWLIQHVADDLTDMRNMLASADELTVALNVSLMQFDDTAFATTAHEIFCAAGIRPQCIEFEITETATAADSGNLVRQLEQLHSYGYSIAIDDFGTGYSSFAKLIELPFDTLKIDKTFVAQCLSETPSQRITDGLIALALQLNKNIVAEGVETPEQFARLSSLGCHYSQGFLHSRAIPLAAFVDYTNELRAAATGYDKVLTVRSSAG